MPLLKLETNVALSADKQDSLLAALSRTVAHVIGKPEQYVMVAYSHTPMLMSGRKGEAALVDVRSIGGLSNVVNQKLTQQISQILKAELGAAPERIYLCFTDVSPENWGWNGDTFA
jgi:phenylpyruvate tautomerase